MRPRSLTPARAAARLGVSPKALRLYEARGLLAPGRTAAGWRAYGPGDLGRAAEIVALRKLGLTLAQVARILSGDPADLAQALAQHEARLERQSGEIADRLDAVRRLRAGLARGRRPTVDDLAELTRPIIAFDLPWPWGGERFELHSLAALTYITGPLGSGKTRLAMRLAEALPGARFLGLDRPAGAEALIVAVAEANGPLVIDMVEEGLDSAGQAALIASLRRLASPRPPLMLMTRSTAVLDLAALAPDEVVLFCPANHSPPILVDPRRGTAGIEAVASCLAAPEVRARTAGVAAAWHAPGSG